jgi:hypothetical protein
MVTTCYAWVSSLSSTALWTTSGFENSEAAQHEDALPFIRTTNVEDL